MKERIVVTNFIKETEFLRTLAKFNSKQFLLRIFTPVEFAKEALYRSGVVIKENIISGGIENFIINDFIRQNKTYFKNTSFMDSCNLASSLKKLRLMITEDEMDALEEKFANGEFKEKNEAIIEIYKKYREHLETNQCIDSIDLIRKAISSADIIDSEIITLKEFPLELLERKLVESIGEYEVKKISIRELFDKDKKEIQINEFVRSYGSTNEFDNILSTIYKMKLPLDKCLIVTASNKYNQLIYDLAITRNIPVTFGNGLSINNSSAYGLFKMFIEHMDNKWGTDTLRRILTSDLFDTKKFIEDIGCKESDLEDVIKIIGDLKLSFAKQSNDEKINNSIEVIKEDKFKKHYVDAVEKTKEILNTGLADIIENYAVIRNDLDGQSKELVVNEIRVFNELAKDNDIKELLQVLGGTLVNKEFSKEGYLHVTGVENAFNSIRENIFVFGLSSNSFPGTPKENYLLLDDDIKMFDEKGHTSNNDVNARQEALMNLLSLASSLDCNINLSYSDFNVAELKKENPASIIFEIYQSMHKELSGEELYKAYEETFKPVSYFEHQINKNEKIGKAYTEGKRLIANNTINTSIDGGLPIIDKTFYPTQIEEYFECPRKFYLKHIENIQEDEEDDPYKVIDAKNTGTLYHEAMERLAKSKIDNNPMGKSKFEKMCNEIFDNYLLTRPALYDDAKENTKKEFIDMCSNGYDQEANNDVINAETKQLSEYLGIKIGGKPDRIEKDNDGNYLIADFKTGKNIIHNEKELETCFQILLYAYMSEKNLNINIDRCEYRYPRLNQVVKCPYNQAAKTKLNELMLNFKLGLESFSFPIADKEKRKDACKYCKLGDICGVKDEDEDEDDD